MESQTIEIDLNPDLFNNVYWHIDEVYDDPRVRFLFVFGGSSASKTFSVVQRTIVGMLQNADDNTLILRKFGTDIKDSIYSDFKNIITEWGLADYFVLQQNFILCSTGSYVRFRGLDDSEKVKGISNFKRVILEEISQFDEVDFKQIRKRLRGKKGQQIIGIFNPISEEHWIKKNVFDKEVLTEVPCDISGKWVNDSGNTVILKTNYLDNVYIVGRWRNGKFVGGFVDQHTIDDFEKDKLHDNAYYQVYGLGNWGRLRTGGEFWKDFNPNTHVRAVAWDESLPVHIGWDDNVNPYLPCSIWQIKGKKAIQIDEICLEDPLNRVKHVINEFKRRYPVGRVKGLFVYGDKTAIKEDTAKEKGENFFTEVMSGLKEYQPRLRMQTANPSVVQSAGFVNRCYAENFEGIEIVIGDNCKKSIHDYMYALEDSDGTLKKTVKKNPVTGVSYQEFGHLSDIKRYVLTMAYANEYQIYKTGRKGVNISIGKSSSKNRY